MLKGFRVGTCHLHQGETPSQLLWGDREALFQRTAATEVTQPHPPRVGHMGSRGLSSGVSPGLQQPQCRVDYPELQPEREPRHRQIK